MGAMMIDYLCVTVINMDEAVDFYDLALRTIGYRRHGKSEDFVAYGADEISFIVICSTESNQLVKSDGLMSGEGIHIAFRAPSIDTVNEFYNMAINLGCIPCGFPCLREYPYGEVYNSFVEDPFGNRIEVVFRKTN